MIMSPRQSIDGYPPNVWLTSFYGFRPQTWGYLGFTTDAHRNGFLNRSVPGVLVVIYIVRKDSPDYGKVVGLLQCSHRINQARAFMSPEAWVAKESDVGRAGRWELGVKAIRAWEIAVEDRPNEHDFADVTYSTKRGQIIGSQGMQLSVAEARRLLGINFIEINVFGETPIVGSAIACGNELFSPSAPGPVSQTPFVVKESEGPTSIYILRLEGDRNAFLNRQVDNKEIIKVGISKSPPTRCKDFNASLPRCAFRWVVMRSNEIDGLCNWPNSRSAIAGETQIEEQLARNGESLGGEFFLANPSAIDEAWKAGVVVAHRWGSTRT